jgi:hypothetical protein
VTLSSDKEESPDVAVHHTKEGIKGGQKRRKGCPQEITTNHDDGNDGGGVGSDMRHILTAAHNDKRQARPPTDHFKRLLKEACPNHVYSVRHKLKDCGIVRSFMTSGSLTWGAELDKDLGRSDTTPFPGESTVMVV